MAKPLTFVSTKAPPSGEQQIYFSLLLAAPTRILKSPRFSEGFCVCKSWVSLWLALPQLKICNALRQPRYTVDEKLHAP